MTWHFTLTRRIRLLLETLLVLIMFMAAVVGWGFWHLSQGPVDLQPFLPMLERTFNSWLPGISFSVRDATLEWNGQRHPFTIHVSQVDLKSPRGRSIGTVEDMTLGVAPQALLLGRIAPTSLELVKPTLTVTRYPDGRIAFRFDRNDDSTDEKQPENGLNIQDIIQTLKADHSSFTAFLQDIKITDITTRYRDFVTGQNLVSSDGHVRINRTPDNMLRGDALLAVPVGDALSPVTADIRPDEKRDRSLMTLRLPVISMTQLRSFAAPDTLSGISGFLHSEMIVGFDNDLHMASMELAAQMTDGALDLPAVFPHTMPVKTGQMALRYDFDTQDMVLHDTHVVLPDTTITLDATLHDPFHNNAAAKTMVLKGHAQLAGLPFDVLDEYWPLSVAPSARHWVTKHIQDGVADKAGAQFNIVFAADAFSTGSFTPLDVNGFKGEIDFTNLTADYLPPLYPVKHIDGQARFTKDAFIIYPKSGAMRDTKVLSGKIAISPLADEADTRLELDLKLSGPLQDALELLAQEPLHFTQKVGLDPAQVSGKADTALHLDFPVINDLELEQLNVKANAKLQNIAVQRAYRDATLRGQDMELEARNDGLTLKGKATLSDAALSSLTWDEAFGSDVKLRRSFAIKGDVTPQLLKDLRLDAGTMFAGRASVHTTVEEQTDGQTNMTLEADLTPAQLSIPVLTYNKPTGASGTLSFKLKSDTDGTRLENLTVAAKDLNVQNGLLRFDGGQNLQQLILSNLRAGRTHASVNAKALPRNKGWEALITGSALDASGLWNDDTASGTDKTTRPPVKLSLDLAALYLDPDYPLQNVKGVFFTDNDVILHADLDAMAGKSRFKMRFSPVSSGNRVLLAESDNAGELLRALNITDSMSGGTLAITGGSQAATPQQIRGNLVLENFTLVKAPLLARLLNAFSLGGLLDLLNQKGLSFSRMEHDFIHQDGQIILKNGRMAGASLGLNFAGTIDQKAGQLTIGGTIVPIQGLNKLARNIPVLGQILTGIKGEGLLAATYSIKGPTKNPQVSVNPLSVLTPGILRSIFFESGGN